MPFIVPNATDIGSLFNSLDQAEPDSLDFQILGDRSTGVLTGCAVSAQTVSDTTVSVAEGVVALKGTVYNISYLSAHSLPSAPSSSNLRFDLIVARLVSGSMVITSVTGPESGTNPTYPPTPSRLATTIGVNTSTYINPDTDVVLAAVYRNGASNVTSNHLVDKRVNVPSTTSLRGDLVPSNSIGSNGDLYYKNTVGPSASGIYVKRDGAWVELLLQSNTGSVTPIGSIIMWPSSTAPDSTFWKECNGQPLSKSAYQTLWGLLGSTYGTETSTDFYIPDLRDRFIRGSTSVGSTGGASSVTLGISNIPEHSHSLSNHTHGIGAHTHGVNISGSGTSGSAGSHNHQGDGSANGVVTRLASPAAPGYLAGYSATADGLIDGLGAGAGYGMQVSFSANTSSALDHQHSIGLTISGNTGGPTASPTDGPSTTNTGTAGSATPTAVSTIPPFASMRWFIRVL